MRIEDFFQNTLVHEESDLEVFLSRRYGDGVNSFWLHHFDELPLPAISLLVKGDISSLVYFPAKSHPGFKSVGHLKDLAPDGTTTFFLDNLKQRQELLNDSVVSFQVALQVAKEFLISGDLPTAIEWFEL